MRGVAYSPDFKALLMGLDQQGESLSALSRRHQVARELLSRWWPRGLRTVQRLLEEHGVNQLPRPPRPKPRRYEKQRPGRRHLLDRTKAQSPKPKAQSPKAPSQSR